MSARQGTQNGTSIPVIWQTSMADFQTFDNQTSTSWLSTQQLALYTTDNLRQTSTRRGPQPPGPQLAGYYPSQLSLGLKCRYCNIAVWRSSQPDLASLTSATSLWPYTTHATGDLRIMLPQHWQISKQSQPALVSTSIRKTETWSIFFHVYCYSCFRKLPIHVLDFASHQNTRP